MTNISSILETLFIVTPYHTSQDWVYTDDIPADG